MTQQSDALATPLAITGKHRECLTEIFRDDINLAVWDRSLSDDCQRFATAFTAKSGSLERFVGLSDGDSAALALPAWALALEGADGFLADVNNLTAMYRCLFEPEAVGLRLHVLKRTMCPRFHVDRVPARLICTYLGAGTQWLPEPRVMRRSTPGPLPEQDILPHQIRQLSTGAVALLKGETWEGNENRGIVHRSPPPGDDARLVVGLDWL